MKLPDCIETERLRIRPFMPGDMDAFVPFMTDDATTTEFMFEPEQKSPQGAREFFGAVIASYATETPYFFCAITRSDRPGMIGTCGISNLPERGVFECSVCMSPSERGHGLATEAVRTLIDYCFGHYRVARFRNYISPRNTPSLRIAARLGMTHAGSGPHPINGDPGEIYEMSAPCPPV